MGIQSLQKFIETHCPTACVPVDLLKIARSVGVRRPRNSTGGGGGNSGNRGSTTTNSSSGNNNNNNSNATSGRLCLVVDGECCLDRLYGGYFSDWVCGGQWNRMVQFLAVLIQTIQNNNIDLAVFFNGCLESQRMDEWVRLQQNERKKIGQVLKHVETKGTPPPKVWWIPPVSLTTCLRMALRHLNITVLCTMDDHHQEVIAYCRENGFHGLMAEDAEYAIFDPPRYFSSEQLKLTYKGSLETKEFILDEVAKRLDLHPNRFCVFATLLGNYLLTEEDLTEFYATIYPENKGKVPTDALIKAVCDFVRTLGSIDNLDAIGAQIFGTPSGNGPNAAKINARIHKFKECVQYYLNGTKEGFLRYRPLNFGRKPEPGHYFGAWSTSTPQDHLSNDDTAKFASETQEREQSSLSAYKEATGGSNGTNNPQIVIDPPLQASSDAPSAEVKSKNEEDETTEDDVGAEQSSSSSASTATPGSGSTIVNCPPGTSGIRQQEGASRSNSTTSASASGCYPHQPQPMTCLPVVPPEVMLTASERHQKGLMSPWIYQVLTHGEVKVPTCLEDDVPTDLPASAVLYRPVRQMVYAVLFNLHHLQFQAKQKLEQSQSTGSSGSTSTESVPDIQIKEWVWTKYNQYRNPDLVKADPLGWPVPTVQRLWFGSTVDDKKRRLRAFLTCMRSDTPLMLNTTCVPQHLLVMCCVLRYILSQSDQRILRRQELNAFLAQAVSPRLMDAQAMQSMQLPLVSARGVQLASLFMRGVECALFANDACGAPIPWLMCCPWLFFDGKLFHYKLLKAEEAKNLLDLCEGQTDQVLKVERMRQAILKGLKVEFARPPVAVTSQPRIHGFPPPHFIQPGASWPAAARGRGTVSGGRRTVLARGGQLEIAGVVVGSWGANYGTGLCGRGGMHMAPQVTSVGGPRKFKSPYMSSKHPGNNKPLPYLRYGGSAGFAPVGVGRGFPTFGVRRPPSRTRRPVGVQFQAARKFRKGGGRTVGTCSSTAPVNNMKGTATSNGSGDGAGASSSSNGQTVSTAAKGGVPTSGNTKVPSTSVSNEDSGESEDSGDAKALKTSPTIMKKLTSEKSPSTNDDDSKVVNCGLSVEKEE